MATNFVYHSYSPRRQVLIALERLCEVYEPGMLDMCKKMNLDISDNFDVDNLDEVLQWEQRMAKNFAYCLEKIYCGGMK